MRQAENTHLLRKYGWPPVWLVWIQLLCLCLINNILAISFGWQGSYTALTFCNMYLQRKIKKIFAKKCLINNRFTCLDKSKPVK